MIAAMKNEVEETSAISLWIDGKNVAASIVWLTQTKAEILIHSDVSVCEGQKLMLVIADFVTLPLRVTEISGQHVGVQFDHLMHRSILQMITREMPGVGVLDMIETLEERAMPTNRFADMEAWLEEGVEDEFEPGHFEECCEQAICDCVREAA